jgi:hypothetical protein
MAETGAIPGWTGSEIGKVNPWNTAVLGTVNVPGVVTVEDLEVGIDIDTKRSKGKDKPTSTDNGLRPARFKLRVWLNESMWLAWQLVSPNFQPRRPGRERQPLTIIRPEVNHLGIHEVRIAGIKMDAPTAKGGLVIKILCEEWFDKPVETKKTGKTAVPASVQSQATVAARDAGILTGQEYRGNEQYSQEQIQRDIDRVTGKSMKPSDAIQDDAILREHLFSGQQ